MKRLLIVVDYQNDFVDGALGFPGAEKLAGPIAAKIEAYRERVDEIVWTLDTHRRSSHGTLALVASETRKYRGRVVFVVFHTYLNEFVGQR